MATRDRASVSGAHHAAELPYVFGTANRDASAEDRQAVDAVHDTWVRFARTGTPGWQAFAPGNEVLNDFTVAGPVVGPDPLRDRLDLMVEAAKAR